MNAKQRRRVRREATKEYAALAKRFGTSSTHPVISIGLHLLVRAWVLRERCAQHLKAGGHMCSRRGSSIQRRLSVIRQHKEYQVFKVQLYREIFACSQATTYYDQFRQIISDKAQTGSLWTFTGEGRKLK